MYNTLTVSLGEEVLIFLKISPLLVVVKAGDKVRMMSV